MKAILYKTDGTKEEVTPKNGKTFSLEEIHGFIGGYMELQLTVDKKNFIVMNEEGGLLELPVNHYATGLCAHLHTYQNKGVRGNVLVCDPDMID
jgi:hypothetical protein